MISGLGKLLTFMEGLLLASITVCIKLTDLQPQWQYFSSQAPMAN